MQLPDVLPDLTTGSDQENVVPLVTKPLESIPKL